MDWKTIALKNLEKTEESEKNKDSTENKKKIKKGNKEADNDIYTDPDFNFDYNYSEYCYNSIDRFKRYINSMDEPLFDDKLGNFTTDLYNFIKYNSYEYSDILRNINNDSDNEFETSDDDYYDENF